MAALIVLLLWHPFAPVVQPGELELTVIDVGQGDSLLVLFPDGKRMLVDGGGIPAFGRTSRVRNWISEKTWWRPTCGIGASALWTWWRCRTPMTTTAAASRP